MRDRPLYLLSMFLFFGAICFGIAGQTFSARATSSGARAVQARHVGDDERVSELRKQSADALWWYGRLMTAALASMVIAIGAWVLSSHRKEQGRASVLVVLVFVAVIVQLVMV